jgi:chemotaxis protein histidine kinase CheA
VTEERRRELANKFRRAARERIASLGRELVALEHDLEADEGAALREVARELHTLKGEARLLGFEAVADVAKFLGAALADLAKIEQGVATRHEGAEQDTTPHVGGDRLAHLAGQATEVALADSRWASIVAELEALVPLAEPALASRLRHVVARARGQAHESSANAAALLDAIRDLQLVPLDAGLARYPRLVRDLAEAQRKSVRLSTEVGDVQIDREVLEALHDPLLHVLRNAVDHGCEPPAERRKAGKSAVAVIRIKARIDGSSLEMSISDDGRGVSLPAVSTAAQRVGLLPEGQTLDAASAHRLLFASGFSTRAEVTEVSGRGVGLDVVKRSLERLGGSASLRSNPGEGSTVVLDVPISSVVVSALAMLIGPCQCALPPEAVVEVTDTVAHAIERLGDARALVYEGELIPLRDLGALTGIAETTSRSQIVVFDHAYGRCALLVDRVLGERKVLHRARGDFLAGSPILRDVGISTDGVTTLVLDPDGIVATMGTSSATAAASVRRVLVVDDSAGGGQG